MNPKMAPYFRRSALTALLLCPALVAPQAQVPALAQSAAPSTPPPADAAATPTSPLSDIRLPEGATLVKNAALTTAVNNLLTGIATKSNFQATGTEVWMWSGDTYKEADAPDIMDAVARKLRRADYTCKVGQPQENETSTVTLFRATSADKSLLGAWRVAKEGIFLGWCELKPAAGAGGATPATPDPAPQPVAPPQPAEQGQAAPKEDAFTTVSRVTGIVMRMGPSRVTSENNMKFLTRMLKKGIGETQGIGPVEALSWQGPAVDEVTIKTDKKDILDAIQKAGYTYQEGATKTEAGDATYTYFTATSAQQNLQGLWRFDPDNHTYILTWAATTATGGVVEGVPSALTAMVIPNDGEVVPPGALVDVLTKLLQRAATADQKTVGTVEVFTWKGGTYKPDQADAIKSAVMDRLQKLGFTADAGTANDGAAMTNFRLHNGAKAIQGLWRKSDAMLLLALGQLN